MNAVFAAAGVFCLVSPQTVEPYVRVIVGVVTMMTGAVNLIETLKIEKKRSWQFAVGLIAAIVMMALGFTMTVAGETRIEQVQQSSGIFLILSAILNIWYSLRLRQAGK